MITHDRDYVYINGIPVLHTTAVRDWVCGVCESRLITKPYPNEAERRMEWRTVCSNDESHDFFIHHTKLHERQHKRRVYQIEYDLVGRGDRMGFVKDRHKEDGSTETRVRKAGRISLGEQTDSGPRSLPYFRINPYDEGDVREAVMTQVREALDEYAPGVDPEQPNILPVFVPASDLRLFARSSYKLSGKGGRPRCVGDGEWIQFKLGPRNLLEISHGEVVTRALDIDGSVFQEGSVVYCPGGSRENRWSHCEKCRLLLQVDLQIAGLPYVWELATGDQAFYDQFFTVVKFLQSHVERGHAKFWPEIPLLLRREMGVKARPEQTQAGTELRYTEMPTLSIEIHPLWLKMVGMDASRALGTPERAAIAPPQQAPQQAPPKWYDVEMPERPWGPGQVLEYVSKAMERYRKENDDADVLVDEGTKAAIYQYLISVLEKMFPEDEDAPPQAAFQIFEYLFGGNLETTAQAAAVYRWARVESGGKAKPHPQFELEVIRLFDEISKVDPGNFGGEEA